MKFFDKWQKAFLIGAGASAFLAAIFYVLTIMTAKVVEGTEDYLIPQYEYNYTYQVFYSTFFFVQLAFGAWFLARMITFKMRKKEALEEQQEY